MIKLAVALHLMLLQKLLLEVKVPNLCSEHVVLIGEWFSPLMVECSRCPHLGSQFDCRSQV